MLAHFKLYYIVFGLLYVSVLCADEKDNFVLKLQQQAAKLNLHEKPDWLNLLHYKENTFSNKYSSEISQQNFFFSIKGRTDPGRELLATLKAMFSTTLQRNPNLHPQCLFIARREWLIDQLRESFGTIPTVTCPQFKQWIGSIDAFSSSLIFPVASVNSPGAMFGHTLLKIEPAKTNAIVQDIAQRPDLKSAMAISFAPDTEDSSGIVFGFKNLIGSYDGKYNIVPYEDKIKEYNNIENRDAWEYKLNLSEKETRRMLMHLWELHNIKFEYYYLYENSAYQVLALLDVARPSLDITSKFTLTVMPIDTIRVVIDAGLVDEVQYKPSTLSDLDYQLDQYAAEDLEIIMDLVKGYLKPDDAAFTSKSKVYQIFLLEIAKKYLKFSYKKGNISTADFESRTGKIASARAELDQTIILPTAPMPEWRPENGHSTSRIILSGGEHKKVKFIELNWRPAYHDLLDSNRGHSAYAKANFLDISARLDDKEGSLQLQHFNLIDIFSQSPRTTFFSPISWKFRTGFNRLPILTDNDTLSFNVNGGIGLSYQPFDPFRFYLLAEVTTVLNNRFDNKISFAGGPNLGMILELTESWKIWLDASLQYYDSQNNSIDYQYIDFAQSYQIKRNLALRLHIKQEGIKDTVHDEVQFSMHMYF